MNKAANITKEKTDEHYTNGNQHPFFSEKKIENSKANGNYS